MRKQFFVIVDEALGQAVVSLDLHFQLAPGKAAFDKKALSAHTDFPQGWNVLVRALPQSGMALEEEEGQVSFTYGKKEPRPAFAYAVRKDSADEAVRFVTLVAPYSGSGPAIDVQLAGTPAVGSPRVDLDIRLNGQMVRVGYNLATRP